MPRRKVARPHEYRRVVYTREHWELLQRIRGEAIRILGLFTRHGINAFVHGSVARGDVTPSSDIDVIIPRPVPSYMVEYILESGGYTVYQKLIVMATPRNTPKAYLVLDPSERVNVSFPLAKLMPREIEFYWFGGALDYKGLIEGRRVPGVDKRLMLIEPVDEGHIESSVIGKEDYAARIIGISVDTVLERIRVLSRRDEVGRTGVFLKHIVPFDSSFEKELSRLASRNPWLRRILAERG